MPSEPNGTLLALLRNDVAGVGPDRHLAPELAAAEAILDSSAMADALASIGVTLA